MWVLLWGGRTMYWLMNDTKYVFGRLSCDIVIEGDPSISRSHLAIAIGSKSITGENAPSSCGLTPFTLTDTSKYGSSVVVMYSDGRADPAPTPLQANAKEWSLPDGEWGKIRAVKLQLGSHGAVFEARWQRIPVVLCNCSHDLSFKVQTAIQRCGLHISDKIEEVEFGLVGGELLPTPAALLALCSGKPIVDALKYTSKLLARHSPKAPPPDVELGALDSFSPAVSDQWWMMTGQSPPTPMDGKESLRTSFLGVSAWRSSLFAGFRFACVEQAVYDEAKLFLPATQARLAFLPDLLQSQPSSHTVPPSQALLTQSIVSTIPILHNALLVGQEAAADGALMALLRTLDLPIIPYSTVVQSIVFGSPRLQLPTATAPTAAVPAAPPDESHDVSPKDVDSANVRQEMVFAPPPPQPRATAGSKLPGQPTAPRQPPSVSATAAPHKGDAMQHHGALRGPNSTEANNTCGISTLPARKTFVKQKIAGGPVRSLPLRDAMEHGNNNGEVERDKTTSDQKDFVKLSEVPSTGVNAVTIAARVARPVSAIDSDDILPQNIEFGAFASTSTRPLRPRTTAGVAVEDALEEAMMMPRRRKQRRVEQQPNRSERPEEGNGGFSLVAAAVSPQRPIGPPDAVAVRRPASVFDVGAMYPSQF